MSDGRTRRGGTPRGFTLLEVIMALLLTALSVTIAVSALRAATVASDGVQAHRDTLERRVRFSSQLTDMMRHAPPADAVDEPLLRVERAANGDGAVTFLSRGVRAPYGTGATWRVSLAMSDSGLVMDAVPIGAATDGTRLHTVLRDVHMFRVLFLERAGQLDGARWREDWPLSRSRPAMISFSFGEGADAEPLVIALDPLATDEGGR